MSKSISITTHADKVKGKKQRSQIVQAMAEALSLIHISEPTRHVQQSRMPSSA